MIQKILKRVLSCVDLALMQTESDARRLLSLGADAEKVRVTGNIKYDQPPIALESEFTAYFSERFALSPEKNPLIVAASTHAPEEKWILEAFENLCKNNTENPPRLLFAPRHPERFDEVAELVRNSGFNLARRSSEPGAEDISAEVILLDSIGELRQVFALAEIVFVGGSLIPHGGQNILEAAIAKRAVITGFYTMNFAGIIKTFEQNEAVIHLPELEENEIPARLAEVFRELLRSGERRSQLAENAFKVMEKNRGAAEKTLNFLRPFLQKRAAPARFASGAAGHDGAESGIPA
jgi:3-deoxy-D-manno-octulosonic-acid transferase